MQWRHLLETRDAAVIAAILCCLQHEGIDQKIIRQVSSVLAESTREGAQQWEQHHLPILYGEDDARYISEWLSAEAAAAIDKE